MVRCIGRCDVEAMVVTDRGIGACVPTRTFDAAYPRTIRPGETSTRGRQERGFIPASFLLYPVCVRTSISSYILVGRFYIFSILGADCKCCQHQMDAHFYSEFF